MVRNVSNHRHCPITGDYRLTPIWPFFLGSSTNGRLRITHMVAGDINGDSFPKAIIKQARIQGGGGQGGLGPPPHKKLLPQIVRRGSRGAKRALAPPPLTKSWIRLCKVIFFPDEGTE